MAYLVFGCVRLWFAFVDRVLFCRVEIEYVQETVHPDGKYKGFWRRVCR